jgi:endogenous inhibitor of DNA gyrase (YacG/DUF329 family)
MAAKVLLCAQCRAVVPTGPELRPVGFPFCSKRCRLLDLGKWLEGDYVLPQPLDPNDHEAIEQVIAHQMGEG